MQLSMVFLLLVSASMMASCRGELDVSFASRLQQIMRTLDEAGMDGIEKTDAEVDEFMLTARRVLRQPGGVVRPVYGDTPAYGAPAVFILGAYGPGAYGSGAYGSGAYGPGAYGSGAYGPGAYGSGAYGSAAYGPGAYGLGASAMSVGGWVDNVLDKAGDLADDAAAKVGNGLGTAGDALQRLGSSAPRAAAASATVAVLASAGAALLGALLV